MVNIVTVDSSLGVRKDPHTKARNVIKIKLRFTILRCIEQLFMSFFTQLCIFHSCLASKENTRQVKSMQDDEASEGYIFDQTKAGKLLMKYNGATLGTSSPLDLNSYPSSHMTN